MKSTPRASEVTRYQRGWLGMTAAIMCLALGNVSVQAADTWTGGSMGILWSNAGNWSTAAPPVVGDDVIMLGPGHPENFANIGGPFDTWTLNSLQFPSGAPSFLIHVSSMTISGPGITNGSGVMQTLQTHPGNSGTPIKPGILNFSQSAIVSVVQINNEGGAPAGGGGVLAEGGATTFNQSSSAGQATINNSGAQIAPQPSGVSFGRTLFKDTSTAGSAAINNFGGTVSLAVGGQTVFSNTSNAGSATIHNIASSVTNARGGGTSFRDNSMAGSAVITNDGASATVVGLASTDFLDSTSAENATIINTAGVSVGGRTFFTANATAGNANITNTGGTFTSPKGGVTQFDVNASADNATINNNAGTGLFAGGGETRFGGGTAGNAVINNNAAAAQFEFGGQTIFSSESVGNTTINGSAGNATINNNGAAATSPSPFLSVEGLTLFELASSAGSATIVNNGGIGSAGSGGQTQFSGTSTAENATIISNPGTSLLPFQTPADGGQTMFSATASAGNATLIANSATGKNHAHGGSITFLDNSTGGTARVEVFGNGSVDISGHAAAGVTIGSLEGSGGAFLGANNLTVGSNNLSTNFSGVAQDGGTGGGAGGSLTKIGTGALALSGTTAYTGATLVNGGKLLVDGSIASSSGVTVAAGATLGGHGNVSSISGAGTIAPGNSPGILTGTHVDPSGGMSFVFELTQTGSPTYGNAAASGNDVLRLTDSTPFTMALNSANQITIDFSNASLAAGELFRGGFFTDSATATSIVSGANFFYTGTGGFAVNFDGFVTEPVAAFAGGTVLNGTVLQFDISGTGTSVPDASSTLTLLLFSTAGIVGLNLFLSRQSAAKIDRS